MLPTDGHEAEHSSRTLKVPVRQADSLLHIAIALIHRYQLNADLPADLATLAKSLKFKLVYISTGESDRWASIASESNLVTDYVFDGTHPPYPPSAPTNPLNLYGNTKRDGELAVLGVTGSKSTVLRVPVLYVYPLPRPRSVLGLTATITQLWARAQE